MPGSQPYTIGPSGVLRPSLAVLPDGEIVFAQIENGDEVHVQRYDALGNPIGSEILPPSDGNVIDPGSMSVTVMPNGGFAVGWESIISTSNPREELSHVQLVDANGNLVGNQAQTDFSYTSVFGVPLPRVTPLANGGFVTSWRGIVDNGNTYEGVQAYNANGNAVGSLLEFQDQSAFGTTFARVFALPEGGFAVVLETADDTNSRQNLHIYDNNGNFVGDVRMEDTGDGSDFSNMLLANQPDGNTLVLYDVENGTLVSSRATVQTLNLNNGTSTPSIQTGILFKQNTVGTVPVIVSIPDPDGSEIVQWIDVAGVPAGWTLSDPGATAVFDGFEWKVIGGNVAHGGEIDLSLAPPANFVGSETLTVTAHVIDTGNGSQNQSIPVTFNVTVTPLEPASSTADMIMRERQQRRLRDLRSWQQCDSSGRSAGPGRHGVAGRGPRRLRRHRHLGHDPAQQQYRRLRSLRHQQQQSHRRRRHGAGRIGVDGFGLWRFQLASRRNRHADAQQQYRRIRDLRHRQQRHHIGGADGPSRPGMVGRGLRRFLDAAPTRPTC